MIARQSVWSDPEVKELAGKFIPAADEVGRLQSGGDAECQLFRKVAEQGHYAEAEEVYRDDLGLSGRIQRCTQHPDNVWALHGIVECLRRRGEKEEHAILSRKLDDALAKTDVPITSSCMCRATTYAPINSGSDCCS